MSVLADNPLLVLFLVVGLGGALGRVRVRGVGLGPAAALFVGLAFSAVDADLANVPSIVPTLGLGLFIYTVGLASGPSFIAGFRGGGARIVVASGVLLALIAGVVVAVIEVLGLDDGARAGLFAGSQTNTPALQASITALADEIASGAVTDPVVGYSIAYPFGVLAMITAAGLSLRRASRKPAAEGGMSDGTTGSAATSATVEVTRADLPTLGELRHWEGELLAFSRVEHQGEVDLATNDVRLEPGDLCTVIGSAQAVAHFTDWIGRPSDRHLALDRNKLDFRRIAVSNRELAGVRLGDLDVEGRFGATVTRVRRGDVDLVADPTIVLRLGDRLRVVGPSDRMGDMAKLFGDSDRGLGEVDAMGFALGLAIGLAIGAITVPIPGGGELALGIGGGPLIAGLVLGTVSRIGPVTWQIPHAANLALRQLGILMFLGGVGVNSGATFADSVGTGTGAKLALGALIVTVITAASAGLLMRWLNPDGVEAAGQLSGFQTQPAVLAFAMERANGDERVDQGYALLFPLGIVVKLILVQFLI
ncbi:MAG: TrkA C-terminal domain-containing protein [Ilumatobacter fluminis]|uniref:aspartate:alanine exchanger family transporter n=1 Tax=Ilumatobacter fluminis TaxID=467091 RepID=UPI0032F09989